MTSASRPSSLLCLNVGPVRKHERTEYTRRTQGLPPPLCILTPPPLLNPNTPCHHAPGGEFTEKMKRRHVHYLVIQEAHGDKFDAAVKWGVPVVRADWVLESAYAGQPLDQLELFLPEGITAEELEARRQQRGMQATQGAGGGGMGSQLVLGPTQRPGAAPPRGMSQVGAYGGVGPGRGEGCACRELGLWVGNEG